MRLLVVEDERMLADYVAQGLRRAGLSVDVSYDGAGALERLAVHDYDVIVLDRDLPDVHGDEICRTAVRQGGRARVLMLTAAGALRDRVEGLGIGADDYLVKPFDFAELVARVHALGRRSGRAVPPVLERAGVRLDIARREAFRGDARLPLTPKEFAVLEMLIRAEGAVVSAEELLAGAWDEHADPFTSAVRVTMSRLRTKLGDPPLIQTVPSGGYRI